MLVSDEDQYKEAPDFVKDNYWIIPTASGAPVLLPIPFEVGLLFKTIPETAMAMMTNKEGGEFRSKREAGDTIWRGITSTLELHPYQVQFMGPILEAVTNHDPFTGRAIVSQYLMTGIEPGAQSEPYTNELARIIGEKLNISPLKIQHVMEGYGGTLGVYLFDVIDAALRSQTLQGDKRRLMPERPWYDYPVIRRVFGHANDKGLVHDAYELHREVNKVYGTFNDFIKEGRIDEARAYIQTRQHLMALRPSAEGIKEMLDKARAYRQQVQRSELNAEEKRQQIEDMDAYINGALKTLMPLLEKMADLPVELPVMRKGLYAN
jgi:hypothetical protein